MEQEQQQGAQDMTQPLQITRVSVRMDNPELNYTFTKVRPGDIVWKDGVLHFTDAGFMSLNASKSSFLGAGRKEEIRECPECEEKHNTRDMREHLVRAHGWKWMDARKFTSDRRKFTYSKVSRPCPNCRTPLIPEQMMLHLVKDHKWAWADARKFTANDRKANTTTKKNQKSSTKKVDKNSISA